MTHSFIVLLRFDARTHRSSCAACSPRGLFTLQRHRSRLCLFSAARCSCARLAHFLPPSNSCFCARCLRLSGTALSNTQNASHQRWLSGVSVIRPRTSAPVSPPIQARIHSPQPRTPSTHPPSSHPRTFQAPAKPTPSNFLSPQTFRNPRNFLSPHTRELSKHFPDNPNPDLKLFIQNYPSFTGYALTILCVFITYSRLFPLKSSRRFLYRPECDTSHAAVRVSTRV